MPLFRKKPVVIDAWQWNGYNLGDVKKFCHECGINSDAVVFGGRGDLSGLFINTLEGEMHASKGDWIIRGVQGEYYPCKPDIFDKTYEPVS